MKQPVINRQHLLTIAVHSCIWLAIIILPYFMMKRSMDIDLLNYIQHTMVMQLALMAVFYVNYFFIIPRYLMKGKFKTFICLNLLFIIIGSLLNHLSQELLFYLSEGQMHPHHLLMPLIFFLRDAFSIIIAVSIAAAIRLSMHWMEMEEARNKAQKLMAEAELTNLRNQLNPHFLLNTLNNIYALIAFDQDKAQLAVQELSKLLRHVLYENRQDFVTLGSEAEFIRNYIELMRIRVASNVTVDTDIQVIPDSPTPIAPLIFISLIENAFKHGVSPTLPSFIRILFKEDEEGVTCSITNSYFPKTSQDKSGQGIGLEQVRRRLELSYPGRYEWQQGVSEDGKEYHSKLRIIP